MTLQSQNGFEASDNRAAIGVKTFAVPGFTKVLLPIKASIAPLLLEMARWFFANVEPPVVPGSWGYAFRPIRGQTSGYSNHASGTAIDLNAPKHPLGERGTMPSGKRAAISAKAKSLGLRWGGDYSGRVDEMHFEVNVNAATAATLVKRLQTPAHSPTPAPTPTPTHTEDDLSAKAEGQIAELHAALRIGKTGVQTAGPLTLYLAEILRRSRAQDAQLSTLIKLATADHDLSEADIRRIFADELKKAGVGDIEAELAELSTNLQKAEASS